MGEDLERSVLPLAVRIGIGMSGWPFGNEGPDALWEWVDTAEKSGVDSIWLTDRVVSDRLNVEPIVALSFIAARTSRMLIGTSVLALPLRQPTILAKEIATLDFLSGGRILPAIGLGTEDEREYQAAGHATMLPRMMGFQAAGAAPIVRGQPVDDPQTVATAIRIGHPQSDHRGLP